MSPSRDPSQCHPPPCHSEAPGEEERRGKTFLEGGFPKVRGTEKAGEWVEPGREES